MGIIFAYTDAATLSEVMSFYEANRAHRDSRKHTVHCLLDVREMDKILEGVLRTRAGHGFTHPRSGQIVLVGATHLARSLVELSARFTGSNDKLKFFDNLEDAWSYLREIIATEQQIIDTGTK